jgi:tetratricopeptide (TPR) repeat protein
MSIKYLKHFRAKRRLKEEGFIIFKLQVCLSSLKLVKYSSLMNARLFLIGAGVGLVLSLLLTWGVVRFMRHDRQVVVSQQDVEAEEQKIVLTPTPTIVLKTPPNQVVLPSGGFISQTFNNCGPATLSMVLSFYNKPISQDILGAEMRPYQNATGDNDDKSIFAHEFVAYAQKNGFESMSRPNGSLETLKKFTANGIPVVVRTWLNPAEDIGHFRVVRGYDDTRQVVLQDDSYQGANLEYSYTDFMTMWEPFNYGYIVVYPKEKEATVQAILADEIDEKVAWKNALSRAEAEKAKDSTNVYALFNIATAQYHLGRFAESVQAYEEVEGYLPSRMLWYQTEPIAAYGKVGNSEKVMSLTNGILNNNNRAFSELYQVRGETFLAQGNKEAARAEFEKALFYNKNFEPAKKSLSLL